MLTLGSLFDGIGTWQLAATQNDIQPLWSSEIEKFPLEVSARHFPNSIQLGDIHFLHADKMLHVDIITASSPCQDISIYKALGNGLALPIAEFILQRIKEAQLASDNNRRALESFQSLRQRH